jgi:hypothetical protein
MDFKEIALENSPGLNWVEDTDPWQAVVNTVMNFYERRIIS